MSTTSPAVFRDRGDAGRRLAARLERLRHEAPVVLALPRGGVPVAGEVAAALAAPLDVLVVHKLGDPGARFGAVAEDGLAVVDHDRARALGINPARLSALREQAGVMAATSGWRLRRGRTPRDIVGRTVVLVDDGVGTGDSAIAAARTARRRGAARIVLAVPVARAAALARLGEELDEVVCVEVAPVARWYEHAPAVSDAEIIGALKHAGRASEESLRVPEAARGAIILATPSETVRRTLGAMGYVTVELSSDGHRRGRRAAVARRVGHEASPDRLFRPRRRGGGGARRGRRDRHTCGRRRRRTSRSGRREAGRGDGGNVARGGRRGPALLRLARVAGAQLAGEHGLAVVPGADHDFTQPGALEQVAHHAGTWFARHL